MALERIRLLPGQLVEIRLSRGYVAIVDLADLPLVAQYTWSAWVQKGRVYALGYRRGAGRRGRKALLHQVLLSPPPGHEGDHRNHDTLDNRRTNLRVVTATQSLQNTRTRLDNKLGLKGVQFHGQSGKYRARIKLDGRTKSLGLFRTAEDAARAYDAAALEFFGEYACTNAAQGSVH